ncbi:hypothetical protein HYR99_35120 [Candidatus Poribacteria bacterium]|nr:hypothetical protein [Candidatus Poribacteria bacterium]
MAQVQCPNDGGYKVTTKVVTIDRRTGRKVDDPFGATAAEKVRASKSAQNQFNKKLSNFQKIFSTFQTSEVLETSEVCESKNVKN